jgi:hypothetical protein
VVLSVININSGPGSLDKKGGRKIQSMFHLCLIKDGTVFPLFCLTGPALVAHFHFVTVDGAYCNVQYNSIIIYFHSKQEYENMGKK